MIFKEIASKQISRSRIGILNLAVKAVFVGINQPRDAGIPELSGAIAALAEAFKATKARAGLCILDSGFSGPAPARALKTVARPRKAFVFHPYRE